MITRTDPTDRYAAEEIPSDCQSWRYCIEIKCAIPLTPTFVRERIQILADPDQEETRRFAATYGAAHLARILEWLRRAEREDRTPA